MTTLTLEMMQRRWPEGNQHVPGLREGIVATAPAVFAEYGLNSPLVIAHAVAQFSEECGQGLEMIESLNYTAAGLLKTFPTHFTPAMAQRWAHNQMMIGRSPTAVVWERAATKHGWIRVPRGWVIPSHRPRRFRQTSGVPRQTSRRIQHTGQPRIHHRSGPYARMRRGRLDRLRVSASRREGRHCG
jgi:putative chitinase